VIELISLILLAIGLVMIVEGLAYLLAPSLIEQVLEILRSLPEPSRRQMGGLVAVAGLLSVWGAFQLGLRL
jgi:uncharacterized protein YjeT (DUF2065 family)